MTQYIGLFALAVALGLAGFERCTSFSGDPPLPITLDLLQHQRYLQYLEPFPRDDSELSAGNQGRGQQAVYRPP